MSAIAKPGAYFAAAINNTTLVPVEFVQDYTKLDFAAPPNAPASTAVFSILFTLLVPGETVTKQVSINFTTSAARNTSYTNYKTTFGASIA
jgi:hypothetical protein